MIKKIPVERLSIGMFVCGNDRKWLETPFFRTKFMLKTAQQVAELRDYCTYVFIDTDKGIDVSMPEEPVITAELQMSAEKINAVVYPEGSIVELSNGQMAVVVKSNPAAPLKPEILLVTDTKKNMLSDAKTISLDDANMQLSILDTLQPDDPLIDFIKLFLKPVTK
ncbi:MAG: hypothetical protein CTY19_00830 [Methylomonas sp.]|nr:MAG: hypothetical protein CTY19_00830 [Methylomonas sp.]